MIHSGMYDDKEYSASDFNLAFKSCLSNGVLGTTAENLQVVFNTNMTIAVKSGVAWIEGSWLYNDNSYTLTIANADGTLHRIDRIVVRQNNSSGENTIVVIKGVSSSSPTAPALVRDGTYYDLSLATIYVAAGTTAITQAMITDTRGDSSVCGYVYALAQKIDTTSLFAQYDAKLTQLIEDMGESEHVDIIVNSDAVSIKGIPIDTVAPTEEMMLIYNPTTGKVEWGTLIPKETLLVDWTRNWTSSNYTTNVDLSAYKGKYRYFAIDVYASIATNTSFYIGINYGENGTTTSQKHWNGTVFDAVSGSSSATTYAPIAQLPYFASTLHFKADIECFGKTGNYSCENGGGGSYVHFTGKYTSANGINTLTLKATSAPTTAYDVYVKIYGVK